MVTGIGIVSAIGIGLERFSRALFAGDSGVREVRSFDPSGFRTRLGAEVESLDAHVSVSRKESLLMDRLSLLAVAAADQAVEDAGLDLERDRSGLGIILGTGLGPSASIEDAVLRADRGRRLSPTTVLRIMLNSPTAVLCARYQSRETSQAHVTACAASSHALAQAADAIRRGELDLCLAGGADAFPSRALFTAWDALEVMTPSSDPRRAVRPFAADRDGFVIGEGAAMLVLESRERAERRGARIRAEILGAGSCSHAPNLSRPSVEGMVDSLERALRSAGLAPGDVAHVNAHGTATELNDLFETRALEQVFGPHAPRLRISATKAAHGHTMGAAGALGAVAALAALTRGEAPPTLNLEHPDPECGLDFTPLEPRPLVGGVALGNSFAFGGHYVSLVLGAPGARAGA